MDIPRKPWLKSIESPQKRAQKVGRLQEKVAAFRKALDTADGSDLGRGSISTIRNDTNNSDHMQ